jgi:hypothetical protein
MSECGQRASFNAFGASADCGLNVRSVSRENCSGDGLGLIF